MITDARRLPNETEIKTDCCIMGGGTAGIVLAMELAKTSINVCVLESGGFQKERIVQQLYQGHNISKIYEENADESFRDYLLSTRSRFLGGSSNCWGGWCRPFDDIDFRQRDWVPNSGWPFRRAALLPFYRRAHNLLKLGPFEYSYPFWQKTINRRQFCTFPIENEDIQSVISQISSVRLGRDYRTELEDSFNITTLLHANVVDIELDHHCKTVTKVRAVSSPEKAFTIAAGCFVLAAGGIENARLLLASRRQCPAGIGNQYDLVGRYFMEHLGVLSGTVVFTGRARPSQSYDMRHYYKNPKMSGLGTFVASHLSITNAAQETHKILNSKINIISVQRDEDAAGVRSLFNLYKLLGGRFKHRNFRVSDIAHIALDLGGVSRVAYARLMKSDRFVVGYRVRHVVEPWPNSASRVFLSDDTDRFGLPKITLDWRYGEFERRTIFKGQILLDRALQHAGLGSVNVWSPSERMPSDSQWIWHHMGTTRMSDDPKCGVVDSSCRVHGISNLFVAGSSVFPTGGMDAPTLTVVAMAIRLADKLKEQFEYSSRQPQSCRDCVRESENIGSGQS
jgi:choline dehydrogenase-like flavoprotein